MGVTPSAQDDAQMALFQENGCDWFIRGIFNKNGAARFTVYYYTFQNFAIDDCPWSVDWSNENPRANALKEELKEKVRTISVTTKHSTGYKGYQVPNTSPRQYSHQGGYGKGRTRFRG